jgi:AAA domain
VQLLCKSLTPTEAPMKTETHPSSSETLTLQPLRPGELASAEAPRLSWLWDGYLAPGKITALISPPKSGKTTLLSHLLARCAQGGLLAGRAVRPGRALIVSEEAASDWDARCRLLALGQNVQFLCRPFLGARPTDAQWSALVAGLETLHRQEALDLVVLDALATLLPGYAETCAPKMLDCLLPLQALANRGPALWLLHHPAKGLCG